MIPVPSGVRVWLSVGHTDMRRGMNGLPLQVQQALGRDPHAVDLYVFRGKCGDLLKCPSSKALRQRSRLANGGFGPSGVEVRRRAAGGSNGAAG